MGTVPLLILKCHDCREHRGPGGDRDLQAGSSRGVPPTGEERARRRLLCCPAGLVLPLRKLWAHHVSLVL